MNNETQMILQPGEEIRPKVTLHQCKDLVKKLYGLECDSIVEINSYDDKNYKINIRDNYENENITQICSEGYVLKILNKLDSQKIAFIEAQTSLMIYLRHHNIKCPKPIKNKEGQFYSLEKINESGDHIVRLLEFLPGQIFCDVPPSSELFFDAGRYLAKIDLILKNFYHEAYDEYRSLWMMESVPQIKQFFYVITDSDNKQLIEEILEQFNQVVVPALSFLEKSILHGDFNEQNIIVRQSTKRSWKVDAILDFGDSQYSYLVFEIAVAGMYMILQGKDLNAAGYFLAGYSTIRPIPEEEYNLLKICIASRFCQSLVLGAYTHAQNPDNKYVLSTQAIGWKMLRELWKKPQELLYKEWKLIAEQYKNI